MGCSKHLAHSLGDQVKGVEATVGSMELRVVVSPEMIILSNGRKILYFFGRRPSLKAFKIKQISYGKKGFG